jgi:hypothetical protein
MLFRNVACQGGFRGEIGRVACLPSTFGHAFGQMDCFEMFLQVGGGAECCAAYSAAWHEPLTGPRRAGC